MRDIINIINELSFDGKDPAMQRAFDIMCNALGVHESAQENLAYKLEYRGGAKKQIDPRDPLNKWTPQQWQDLHLQVGQYFDVEFGDGVLEIRPLRGTPSA
jgi:hypothetical protein